MRNAIIALSVIGWIWTVAFFLWFIVRSRGRQQNKTHESNEVSSS